MHLFKSLRHRRRQPSSWNAVCSAACVARNRAWRTTTGCVAESYLRFSAARQQFHRTVRGRFGKIMSPPCQHTTSGLPQRQFDELSSAAPIPAKLNVCGGLSFQTLQQGTTEWPSGGSTLRGKCGRGWFSQLSSSQGVGSFDGLFSPSELRRAMRGCVNSAVGLDRSAALVAQGPVPWWHPFFLVLSRSVIHALWKRSIVVHVVNRATPVLPPTIVPSLSLRAVFKLFEHLVHFYIGRSSLPNSTSAKEDSDGVLKFWSLHTLMLCHLADPLSHIVAFVDIKRACGAKWLEALWSKSMM